MSQPELLVIAQIPAFTEGTRVYKLCRLLEEKGYRFLVWKFGVDETDKNYSWNVVSILSQRWKRINNAIRFVAWMISVFWRVLSLKAGTAVYTVGFESALPVAVARAIGKQISFLFDNSDNISKSHLWPAPIKKLLEKGELFVASKAALHLVPGLSRWSSPDVNLRVVGNTPSRSLFEVARQLADRRLPANKRTSGVTLYINGWLTKTRGIPTLLRALQLIDRTETGLRVLVAGNSGCEEADTLIQHPRVQYLGALSNEEALSYYFDADLVFTYYDPAIEINTIAEPNKWGDCIATKTPFIVNSEVLTAAPYLDAGVCFALPYHDAEGLANLLMEVAKDQRPIVDASRRMETIRFGFWDEAMSDVLDEFSGRARRVLSEESRAAEVGS